MMTIYLTSCLVLPESRNVNVNTVCAESSRQFPSAAATDRAPPGPCTPEGTMSAVSLLLLLLPLVSAQTYHWGPCPDPKVQPGFNVEQYLGRWYEIEKLPASFERGKCIEANYAVRKDGTIRVLNTQFYKDKVRPAEGTAVIQDPREPAKLGVSFSYFTPYSPYWILTTDYTSLSVVYSCTDILRIFHIDYAWILGRSRFLPPETVQYAKELLINEGIDLFRMKATDQTGCKDD